MPVGDTVSIRGNGRESATAVPLQARRPLSIVLVRSATVMPATAADALYELPPIGLAYLAAFLKKAGHRVRIIDAFGEHPGRLNHQADGYTTKGLTAEGIIARIPRDVDLIGVSCMFSNSWLYCRSVIADIAAAFRDVPIIVGGEHATADYLRLPTERSNPSAAGRPSASRTAPAKRPRASRRGWPGGQPGR